MSSERWRWLAIVFAATLISNYGAIAASTNGPFASWPPGESPQEIGKRVAERFVPRPHGNFGRTNPPTYITYPETCTWYGALTFAKAANDPDLTARLIKRFEPLFGEESKLVPKPNHVDLSVFGSVPLEIYIQNGDKKYLELGQKIADAQWATQEGDAYQRLSPAVKESVGRGLTWQTRFWIDDMFMITMVQVQAYRATHDKKYVDRAATEMVAYLDKLQQTNGLFFHAPDVPFFWGRGDGWVAAGMSELLRSLPADHPQRERIMAGYKKMMAALLRYQDEQGMWHQLIDHPEAWPETSCTAMFTFAMITGTKEGWLEEATYGLAARKGWLGLVKYINADGDVREVCEGSNKRNSLQYYLDRGRNVGDMHGQAPTLWCATALLRPAREAK